MKSLNPANPVHLWRLRKELGAYAKWSLGQKFLGRADKERRSQILAYPLMSISPSTSSAAIGPT